MAFEQDSDLASMEEMEEAQNYAQNRQKPNLSVVKMVIVKVWAYFSNDAIHQASFLKARTF